MSKTEIAHFTTHANVDILTTKADETANQDQHSHETNEPEQDSALDLSGYEARESGEPESSFDSSQVLDLSSRDTKSEELDTLFASPEPSLVKPVNTSSPASTKSEFKIKVVEFENVNQNTLSSAVFVEKSCTVYMNGISTTEANTAKLC